MESMQPFRNLMKNSFFEIQSFTFFIFLPKSLILGNIESNFIILIRKELLPGMEKFKRILFCGIELQGIYDE